MNYRRKIRGSLTIIAVAMLLAIIIVGCQSQIQEPMRAAPGQADVASSIAVIRAQVRELPRLKASGQCFLRFTANGERYKENFSMILRLYPPDRIYFQGNPAFAFMNKAICFGANGEEFWFSIKPEINTYWWGRFAEIQQCLENFVVNINNLFEAFGIVNFDSRSDWALSSTNLFDILTKRNIQGQLVKRIYIYKWDYSIRRIVYFGDGGQTEIVMELNRYKELGPGFFVPSGIKVVRYVADGTNDTMKITLNSVKLAEFSARQLKNIFTRPQPKGFKHIYRVDEDCRLIEQLQ